MKLTKIILKLAVNSINKRQLKDTRRADCKGCLLAIATDHNFLLGLKITKSSKYVFQVQVMFDQNISCSVFSQYFMLK